MNQNIGICKSCCICDKKLVDNNEEECDNCGKIFCRRHGYACFDYDKNCWYDYETREIITDLSNYMVEVESCVLLCSNCRIGYKI